MPQDIVMINDQEDEKRKLNNVDLHINRGFMLMLKHNSKKEEQTKPKTFSIRFCKLLSLLSREIQIDFNFSFNVTKK